MTDDRRPVTELGKQVRVLQIIIAALVAGAVIFLVVAGSAGPQFAKPDAQAKKEALPLITLLTAAGGTTILFASFLVPGLVVRVGRKKIARGEWKAALGINQPDSEIGKRLSDDDALHALLLTKTIMNAAMIEGAVYLTGVAYLVERTSFSLGMSIMFLVILAMQFPSRRSCEQWLERQKRYVQQEREWEK